MPSVVPVAQTARILAIVQAGGQGSRMDVLTRERAKPALPFAGSYQLVDFALSNLAHSGIPDVWVSVQYQAGSLDEHLAGGRPWDLDRTRGGYRRLVPEEGDADSLGGFSTGNADNLMRIADDIASVAPDVVVVTSADHIFRLDLRAVIDEHLRCGAEATIVTSEVSLEEARHKAVVDVARDGHVRGLAYKPAKATRHTVASEIFVYRADVLLPLLDRLRRELADDGGLGDFGEHLLPELIARGKTYAYAMSSYWRDLGRPSVYLAAHRDFLLGRIDVFDDPRWPMLTRFPELPPAFVASGGVVADGYLSAGVRVAGTVRRSVLGPSVMVEEGAVVEDSVLMTGVCVRAGARVQGVVADDAVEIGAGAQVGGEIPRWPPPEKAVTLLGRDSVVGPNAVVAAGGRLEPGASARAGSSA
ncbi:MAG: NTP transferase domain-containing protein [Tetrasphaera jenkinsii]|jgi:glucose-1-phosphate adenylyltransferase|nr:NTP transferase domain-containing protein [Tetrasphaera jenkinsii]